MQETAAVVLAHYYKVLRPTVHSGLAWENPTVPNATLAKYHLKIFFPTKPL